MPNYSLKDKDPLDYAFNMTDFELSNDVRFLIGLLVSEIQELKVRIKHLEHRGNHVQKTDSMD